MNSVIMNNWDSKGVPVFVVFNEIEVLGVFMEMDAASKCLTENLNYKYPPIIQPCNIEGLKSFSYELQKSQLENREPELIALDNMRVRGTFSTIENMIEMLAVDIKMNDAYIISDYKNDDSDESGTEYLSVIIYKRDDIWYRFKYIPYMTTTFEYKGEVEIKCKRQSI